MAKKKSGIGKWIKRIVLLVLLVIIGGGIYLFVTLNSLARTQIVDYSKEYMGVDVELEDAEVSVFSGYYKITGLKISNPEGYRTPTLIEIPEMTIKLEPMSVFANKIIIEDITIKDAVITYEHGKTSNLDYILNRMDEYDRKNYADEEIQTWDTASASYLIKSFAMRNTTFRLNFIGKWAIPIKKPNLVFENMGADAQDPKSLHKAMKQKLRDMKRIGQYEAQMSRLRKKKIKID